MKKIIFMLATLCVASVAFGQTTFGIKAGPDFSSYSTKSGGSSESSKMIVGVSGGVFLNLPIADEFYIQPSLMYEGKGGKDKDLGTKSRLNYLTLPINLVFRPEMSSGNGSWIIGAGAYLGYGLSGKVTSSASDSTSMFILFSDPFKKDDYGDDPLLKRFDLGADVQVGYEMFNGFNIRLNGELGLINVLNKGDSDHSFRNISFSVMVGYAFERH